jgi:hypothetical protein
MSCDPNACPKANAKQGMVTLVNGNQVCTYCPRWMIECEASFILTFPLQERRAMLEDREKIRGKDSVDQLRNVMREIHEKRRKAYDSDH